VTSLIIPARFNGPSDSGNGGVAAGRLARFLPSDATVQVTLRVPPPLDQPMRVEQDEISVRALDGDTLVAEAVVVAREPEQVPRGGAAALGRGVSS